jgi:hypothetical protein
MSSGDLLEVVGIMLVPWRQRRVSCSCRKGLVVGQAVRLALLWLCLDGSLAHVVPEGGRPLVMLDWVRCHGLLRHRRVLRQMDRKGVGGCEGLALLLRRHGRRHRWCHSVLAPGGPVLVSLDMHVHSSRRRGRTMHEPVHEPMHEPMRWFFEDGRIHCLMLLLLLLLVMVVLLLVMEVIRMRRRRWLCSFTPKLREIEDSLHQDQLVSGSSSPALAKSLGMIC